MRFELRESLGTQDEVEDPRLQEALSVYTKGQTPQRESFTSIRARQLTTAPRTTITALKRAGQARSK
jgi:hypothetical protein